MNSLKTLGLLSWLTLVSTSVVAKNVCHLPSWTSQEINQSAQRIRALVANPPASSVNKYTIYVSGTNEEDGSFQQFDAIKSSPYESDRVPCTIDYSLKDDATGKDARSYDKSVEKGKEALNTYLNTLITSGIEDIRVFGHSKGAHIVTYTAMKFISNPNIRFWAIAQPGRIKIEPSPYKNAFGKYGAIDKHSRANLVTINWANDEVGDYGQREDEGLKVPRSWNYPGFINHAAAHPDGNVLKGVRIDHHKTYGGDFTIRDCRYRATGDNNVYDFFEKDQSACKKESGIEYRPWFWGSSTCADIAYAANGINPNNIDPPSLPYHIGPSGLRQPGTCLPHDPVDVAIEIEYWIKANDKNIAEFYIGFFPYNNAVWKNNWNHTDKSWLTKGYFTPLPFGRISNIKKWKLFKKEVVNKRENKMGGWGKKTFRKQLPYSFMLHLDPSHHSVNGIRDNRLFISHILITYPDPVHKYDYAVGKPGIRCTGPALKQEYILGPRDSGVALNSKYEGRDAIANLANDNLSGWRAVSSGDGWTLIKTTEKFRETLLMRGNGNKRSLGFYKPVSLID